MEYKNAAKASCKTAFLFVKRKEKKTGGEFLSKEGNIAPSMN